ncbi:MAG: beta-N-acetylhexosaminidase [Bacillota bacterium]
MKKQTFLILLSLLLIISYPITAADNNYHKGFNLVNFFKSGANYLIDYKLKNMSLEEKVGQLFQVGFQSKSIDREIKDLIENYHIGGVIYFTRNIENLEQTASLSKNLQELALDSGAGIPLFISVDQEGGKVRRIKDLTYFPANIEIGATGDKELSRKAAAVTAKELKGLGINVNLAPVLDVNNNPANPVIGERSFGADPILVAEMGVAYIKGLQAEGIIATAKHFPGHGDTAVDSHFDLPVINHSRERLDQVELYPFKKAIEAGVDSIMVAHIYFSTIESEAGIPATLSKAVLNDLLREELNFEGVIITDDLEMGAITNFFGTAAGAVKTIEAGADIVLISHSYDKQKQAIEAVIAAVENGRISEKRIEESLRRIIKLKGKRINIF